MDKTGRKKRLITSQEQGYPDRRPPARNRKFQIWKGLLTSLIALTVFICLIEGVLAIFGVAPEIDKEDPFVGFASHVPLFETTTGPGGEEIMATAPNKRSFFNEQEFPLKKASGTYRIFTLGGSTTYGRPYDDKTSFAGWLRELLPVADQERNWEVINTGGISYASYRVAHLMEELVRYEPDLFIIYTGHNEFLEERTYGTMRDTTAFVRDTAELLSRTRIWSAMSTLLNIRDFSPHQEQDERYKLSSEVTPLLNLSAGLERYKRDDALHDRILAHYRISLSRMVDIASSVGADVIFVTAASNLKDSSPFKSQHASGLTSYDRLKSEKLLSTAIELIRDTEWSEALKVLDKAIEIDPRFAEFQYQRGKALFALGRYNDAAVALRKARDEDVCQLRALSPMNDILAEVADEKGVTLVDFVDLISRQSLSEHGHSIAGKEYFLDHVHPTIQGHRLLAVKLIETMAKKGVVKFSNSWGEETIARVATRVEAGINKVEHARALVNLVRVLNWARKFEDALRIAKQVISSGVKDPEVIADVSSLSAAITQQTGGDDKDALSYYRKALANDPGNPRFHLHFGLMFMDTPLRDFEVAGAHILIASVLSPDIQMAHMNFGLVMAERRRYSLAYLSIKEALRMDPQDTGAEIALDRLSTLIGQDARNSAPSGFAIEEYDSGYPNKVVQVRQDSSGREVPDGIWTEWHENGMLKRFIDYEEGVKHGFEINWDPDGKTVSRVHYNRGVRIGPSRQDAELQDYSVTRTHYERGVELAAEGKLDKALENLKTAVSLHPYSAAFHNMLGVVYARKGVLDNAIEEFRIANGLDPSEPAYQRNLDRASRLNNEGSR